jgi:methylphosphotriester-DNA--protein-cysteine methyltransferase
MKEPKLSGLVEDWNSLCAAAVTKRDAEAHLRSAKRALKKAQRDVKRCTVRLKVASEEYQKAHVAFDSAIDAIEENEESDGVEEASDE